MRQIVLDTETTGLDPKSGHRIIEIGCVELVNRQLTGNHYHQYINPEREIDAGALAVHGISNEFLADKPLFSKVIDEFMQFVDGAELIIHNAPFDVGFLDHEMRLHNRKLGKLTDYCTIFDTLTYARKKHPGQKNSLDALCKRYDIDNSHRDLHGALLDAEILAIVYLAMTGGQSSLFGQDEQPTTMQRATSEQHVVKKTVAAEIIDLTVLPANEEELQAHQLRLEALQEKGQCLWLNDELEKQ